MIELGRRGFLTGLAALVAAPAVIRVAPLMKISTARIPLYVPVNWLADIALIDPKSVAHLKSHAWPRPMADNWVDINNDVDSSFLQDWVRRVDLEESEYWLS